MHKNILALQTSFSASLKRKEAELCVLKLIEDFFKNNKTQIDFLFLPEFFLCGWQPSKFELWAEEETGKTVYFLQNIARTYSTNVIGGTYVRKEEDLLKNSCPIIDRNGELVCHYDKIHTFTPGHEGNLITKGKDAFVIKEGNITIGLSICYDIRFPELFRNMIKHKPHLFVNLSAWPKIRLHDYQVLSKARAIENQAYFLGLSQTGKVNNYFEGAGNSILVSPRGEVLKSLREDAGVIFETLDIESVNKFRNEFKFLEDAKEFDFKVKEIDLC